MHPLSPCTNVPYTYVVLTLASFQVSTLNATFSSLVPRLPSPALYRTVYTVRYKAGEWRESGNKANLFPHVSKIYFSNVREKKLGSGDWEQG